MAARTAPGRLARRLYGAALRTLPASLRREYGQEMAAAFAQAYRERRRRGRVAAVGYLLRGCADVLATSLRDRIGVLGVGTRIDPGGPQRGLAAAAIRGIRQDLRVALRALRHNPAFTLAAILVLALGVGLNATLFVALRAALLEDPPYPEPERLVLLDLTEASTDRPGLPRPTLWSWPKFRTLVAAELPARPIAAYAVRSLELSGRGKPQRITVEVVSPGYFRVLGTKPVPGTDFATFGPGADHHVILAYELWRDRFGSDPGAVGAEVRLDRRPMTVVGVAPRGFRGLSGTARAWIPVPALVSILDSPFLLQEPAAHWLQVVGRLRPGATLADLQQRMEAIGRQLAEVYPPLGSAVGGGGARSLRQARRNPQAERAVVVLSIAAALVLLTACANLVALWLARGWRRTREIAVRLALGAPRVRIVRWLLVEAGVVALAGGGGALLVARGGVRGLVAAWPERFLRGGWNLQFVDPSLLTLGPGAVALTIALAVLVGLLVGLAPTLSLTRHDLAAALRARDATERAGPRSALPRRQVLAAGETAVAVLLTISAGVAVGSLSRLARIEPGFDPQGLLTFEYVLPRRSAAAAHPLAFHEEFLRRIRSLPGVLGATAACVPPLGGRCMVADLLRAGELHAEFGYGPRIGVHTVDDDFFRTLGVPVLRGRTFRKSDRPDGPPVVVLNETAARSLFGDADPVGQPFAATMELTSGGRTAEIVGVVGDLLYDAPGSDPMPEVYVPLRQQPQPSVTMIVRAQGEPLALLPAIRARLAALDPALPIYGITTVQDLARAQLGDARVLTALLTLMGGTALLLAVTGIWGVVATAVLQRRREIGVRMALGARAGQVVALLLRQGLASALAGAALGLAGAVAVARVLASVLPGAGAVRMPFLLWGLLAALAATVLASWLPARRAARIDPVATLRTE